MYSLYPGQAMSYSYRSLSESYAKFRHRLILGMLTTALLAIGVVAWKIYASYEDEQNAARVQSQTFVHAIEAHVSHSIQLADLSLIGFANIVKMLPEEKINDAGIKRAVAASQGSASNADFSILFIDASGIGVAASDNIMVHGVSFADRDYFKVHAFTQSDIGPFVGEPDLGRISKRRLFFISRRVDSAEGKFLGVIAASMDASRFSMVFASARFNEDVSVALVHKGGKVIARSPRFEQSFAISLSKTPFFKHLQKASAGTYQATSAIDHRARVYSYRTLDNLPLVVGVGISSEVWNKALKKDLLIGGMGLLMMAVIMYLSGYLALKSYSRLEGSESRYRQLYIDIQAAEDKLSRSEKRLRTITDNLPVLISYIDKDQKIQFGNGTIEAWLGIAPSKVIGLPLPEVIGAGRYAELRGDLERALAGERVEVDIETNAVGVTRYLHTTYIPDRAADGSIAGIYTLGTDVTELKRSERRVRTIADNMPALISYIDAQERYVFCNNFYRKVLGIDADGMLGKTIGEVFGSKVHAQIADKIAAALKGHRMSFEHCMEKGNARCYLQYEYIPEFDLTGQVVGFYTMVTDTTAHKEIQLKMAASEKLLRTVANHMPALISFIDVDGRFQFNNAEYEKLLSRPLSEITGRTLTEVYGEAAYAPYKPYFEKALTGQRCDFEFEATRKGLLHYFKASYVPQFDDDGKVTGVCGLLNDITSLKETEHQLNALARSDSLTGLPNRNQLHERLAEAIGRSSRSKLPMAVLFLDIDHFKAINDTLGHHGGDLVLKEFGRRLSTCVRQTDMVARLSGDEFIIVLEGLREPNESELVAAKVIEAMQDAFDIEGTHRQVTTSIGIAVRHREKTDAETMLRKADEALYLAKSAGRNTFKKLAL